MMPPCGGCPDRRVGCHGSCGKYHAFNAERELIRRRRAEEAEILRLQIKTEKTNKTKR